MNNPFRPLDHLKNRPVPAKRHDIFVEFKTKQISIDDLPDETTQQSIPQTKLTIIDKRNEYNLNRNEILERLRDKNAFKVPITRKIASAKSFTPSDIQQIPPPPSDKTTQKIQIDEPIPNTDKQILPEQLDLHNSQPEPQPPIPTLDEVVNDKQPKKKGRKKKSDDKIIIQDQDINNIVINDSSILDRLPKSTPFSLKTSSFYMDNRKMFIQKMNELFKNYFAEIKDDNNKISCNTESNPKFELLTHQKVIRDYFNVYTPYRGLLLYHGLGSGKTCSSIALAEGMKNDKPVYIMTPASLKMNFFSELKKCGDELYKKNQFWEFVSIDGKSEYINVLSQALNLSTDFIKNNGGAWLVNVNKKSNFSNLSSDDQSNIDEQLNFMIRSKYIDINYNGLNFKKLNILTQNSTINPFDNAVVVIDEAHNFVSRIVNKIKTPSSISYKLYDYLMNASNVRIILLTGTPIINYPNEVAILFNILRGYIKTWKFYIGLQKNTNDFIQMFDKSNFKTFDFIDYKDNTLIVTRNPYGFINTKKRGVTKGTQRIKKKGGNKTKKLFAGSSDELFHKYNGVKLDTTGNISDSDFMKTIMSILKKNNITISDNNVSLELNKCLPDSSDEFNSFFIDNDIGIFKNTELFQKRILGLTSYFRSAQEQLLPRVIKTDDNKEYHIVKSEMSKHQFSIYEKIRKIEADKERSNKKAAFKKIDDDMLKISSTYKIFSRSACNFAFPSSIVRPQPPKKNNEVSEDEINGLSVSEKKNMDTYIDEDADEDDQDDVIEYNKQIENTLKLLEKKDENGDSEFLSPSKLAIYSPKFLNILENLTNPDYNGLHLIYSQFRTIEGIGILRLVLLANGFAEFKIKKIGSNYEILENDSDIGKPKFVLYTGTESSEEKEIIRNIYNSSWDQGVPSNIVANLTQRFQNNKNGDVIKAFMITASGAEGINLKNTRFVHIVEPYWHMVRIEQVIGRAKRICSHQDLPPEHRTLQIFLYISTLSHEQKTSDKNIELRDRDRSRIDNKTPVTTDETLFEIASIKHEINAQILHTIKETAIDCDLYSQKNKDENIVCYGFGKVSSNNFSYYPSFKNDKTDDKFLNIKLDQFTATVITLNGTDYALNELTNDVYDLDAYNAAAATGKVAQLRPIGMLSKIGNKYQIVGL